MGRYYERIIVYFDGASRNNPRGPAGCGWLIYEMDDDGAVSNFIDSGKLYLGYNVSNNQAEYKGLYEALKHMEYYDISCYGLYIRGDSEVVLKQLEGEYQVRSNNIIHYYNDVVDKLGEIDYSVIKYTHIGRSLNYEADELANEAIDE